MEVSALCKKKQVVYNRPMRATHQRSGFSLVEVLVLSAIVALISSVVLFNFTGFGETTALNRATRELALAMRQAQNVSLSIHQVGGVVPPFAGVKISTSALDADGYTIFGDLNDPDSDGTPDGNKLFDAPPDVRIDGATFGRGIAVSALKNGAGATITPAGNTVNLLFSPPEARVSFSDGGGNTLTETAIEVVLKSPSGNTRSVVVRISGQIAIR